MVQKHVALPQRVKSNSDPGFALLSLLERLHSLFRAKRRNLLCSSQRPLSLSHGFFTIQPSLSREKKKGGEMGPGPIFNLAVEKSGKKK
jgi:hypothetical protein